ncbi:MAG: polyhydroxyalkanoate synthesis regulator phasin, partial [Ilumatobacter sp.]
MANSSIQKLIDTGMQFTEPTRKQAEKIVQKLVKAGDLQKGEAEKAITQLVERGKETTERVTETVQREVAKQVGWMSERFDELEDRFEELAEQLADRVGANDKKKPTAEEPETKKTAT